ncbi:hypothetical protein [Methanosphaera sp.]
MTSGQATARIKNIEEWHKFKENAEKNGIKIGEALEQILVAYNNNSLVDIKEYDDLQNEYNILLKKVETSEKKVIDIQEENNILEKKLSDLNN